MARDEQFVESKYLPDGESKMLLPLNAKMHRHQIIMTPLISLPNELLLKISFYLDSLSDLNAFCQVNGRFYHLRNDSLYCLSERREPGQAIRWAAKVGNQASAKKLIKKCNNLLNADNQPIIIAAMNGHTKLVKLFLKHGFSNDNAEEEDEDGATVLKDAVIGAVRSGQESVVRVLFNYKPGVHFYQRNFFAAFPLCEAARYHHLSLVDFLIKCGCDVNGHKSGEKTALALIASTRATNLSESDVALKIARRLVHAGADIQIDIESMLEAVKLQNITLLQLLIDNGFSPDRLGTGDDVLKEFSRTKRKNQAMAAMLLDWIDVDRVIASGSRQRFDLLKGAIFHQLDTLLKTLIEEKHFLDEIHKSERLAMGCCPMKLAACYGCQKAIQVLLAHGVSPDGEAGDYQPLELAIDRSRDFETAKLLLDNGANGALVLGNAINRGHRRVIDLISPYVLQYRSTT